MGVTIPAYQASVVLTFQTINDQIVEEDGELEIVILTGRGYLVQDAPNDRAVITITDNENLPELSITFVHENIVESDDAGAEFVIQSSQVITTPLDVTIELTEFGQFLADESDQVVTIGLGDIRTNFVVDIVSDDILELSGYVDASLQTSSDYVVSSVQSTARVYISDDDNPPGISIISATPEVNEAEFAKFVMRSATPMTENLLIELSASGTGVSFLPNSTLSPVTFPSGQTEHKFSFQFDDDDEVEETGELIVTIDESESGDYEVAASPHNSTSVIVHDNDKVELSITGSFDVLEGETAEFVISSSGIWPQNLLIDTLVDQGDSNFLRTNSINPIVLSAGERETTLYVPTQSDEIPEEDGIITATLQTNSEYRISQENSTASVKVEDDDLYVVGISASLLEYPRNLFFPITEISVSHNVSSDGIKLKFKYSPEGELSYQHPTNQIYEFILSRTQQPIFELVEMIVGHENFKTDRQFTLDLLPGEGYEVDSQNRSLTFSFSKPDIIFGLSISPNVFEKVEEGTSADFEILAPASENIDRNINLRILESGDMITGVIPNSITLPAGDSSVVLSIPTVDDAEYELDSEISVIILPGSGYDITQSDYNSAKIEVLDNDLPAGISIISLEGSVAEGTPARFRVLTEVATSEDRTIEIVLSQIGDYIDDSNLARTITLPAEQTQIELSIATDADEVFELDGGITATIVENAEYTIADSPANSATVVILDDDIPAGISIQATTASVTEDFSARFQLVSKVIHQFDLDIVVDITQTGDYMADSVGERTITLPANMDKITFDVLIDDDVTDELDGSITATVQPNDNYLTYSTSNSATMNILDNDVPLISIAPDYSSLVYEGNNLVLVLTASQTLLADLSIQLEVTETGSFLQETEIAPIVFNSGSTERTFIIRTEQDSEFEYDGSITVEIIDGVGYLADETNKSVVMTFVDDDLPSGISIVSLQESVVEGEDAIFQVTAEPRATEEFLVQLEVVQGDADVLPSDTSVIPTSVTFEVGDTEQEVRIPTVADENDEEWGNITVNLTSSTSEDHSLALNGSSASMEIRDDDPPTISITSVTGEFNGQPSNNEGSIFNFVIESSTLIHTPLTVALDVVQTGNYVVPEANPAVTIPANQYSAEYSITSTSDSIQNLDGQVLVQLLESGSGHYLVDANANSLSATIENTDSTFVEIYTTNDYIEEGEDIVVYVSTPWSFSNWDIPITLEYTDEDSVISGAKQTEFEISAGETTTSITIPTTEISGYQRNRILEVALAASPYYTISNTAGSIQLEVYDTNLPAGVAVLPSQESIIEGENAKFQVTMNPPTERPEGVNITLSIYQVGSFLSTSRLIVPVGFSQGQTYGEFEVATVDDEIYEVDGSLTARINGHYQYSIAHTFGEATVQVLDNDAPTGISIIAVDDSISEGDIAKFRIYSDQPAAYNFDVLLNVEADDVGITGRIPTQVRVRYLDTYAEVALQTIGDHIHELNGSITIELLAHQDYSVASCAIQFCHDSSSR